MCFPFVASLLGNKPFGYFCLFIETKKLVTKHLLLLYGDTDPWGIKKMKGVNVKRIEQSNCTNCF